MIAFINNNWWPPCNTVCSQVENHCYRNLGVGILSCLVSNNLATTLNTLATTGRKFCMSMLKQLFQDHSKSLSVYGQVNLTEDIVIQNS